MSERREREKEQLRLSILEAARDILSERGLEALSVREIAKRIEYSPATIYLYFRDKTELIQSVVVAAFTRLGDYMREDLRRLSADPAPVERLMAVSRAYVRFALENTAYFRVMFELPTVAQFDCEAPCEGEVAMTGEQPWHYVLSASQDAVEHGQVNAPTPQHCAVMGWGLIHGMTSLYLGGHLRELATTADELWSLIEAGLARMFGAGEPRYSTDLSGRKRNPKRGATSSSRRSPNGGGKRKSTSPSKSRK